MCAYGTVEELPVEQCRVDAFALFATIALRHGPALLLFSAVLSLFLQPA
jgi:hypothetical protein